MLIHEPARTPAVGGLARDMRAPEPEGTSAPGRSSAADLPLLLIVDDDPLVRHLVRQALEGHYRIEVAADGAEGLQRALTARPDIVLTDLIMPTMTGLQLLHALRTARELDDTPVVILTSSDEESERIRLLREGAQDFVQKPFSLEELRARIDNLAHSASARRSLKRELASRCDDLELLEEEVARCKRESDATRAAMQAARDHARHASEVKGQFLGLVSHELRTPLAALGLQVHLLRESTLSDRQRDLTGRIERSSRRLIALVESLLDRARIEARGVAPSLAPFDLGEVVRAALAEHAQEAGRKGLTLEASGGHGVRVDSDAHLLRLMLSSLLDNAVKFTSQGGVTVVASLHGDHCAIAVRDTGPGIDPEGRIRLFSPFETLTPIEHKHVPGIGLGLALVRDLAQALGARLEVESTVGAGSTFTVRLPLGSDPAPRSSAQGDATGPGA